MSMPDRVTVGRSDVAIARLGLGGAPLGGLFAPVSDEEARATIERAWAAGIRFFDTAPLYGHGLSEQRLGTVLSQRPRDEFALATKVGRLLRASTRPEPSEAATWPGAPPLNPVFDFSSDAVLRSLEESLIRLGLDRVEIVHIHDPDEHYEQALRGAYPALDRLRSEGVIGAVGVGMNQAEMLARFAREADFDCFLVAGRYTLLDQAALGALMPLCLERRISVIVGGVFNSGILAGPRAGATFDYAPAPPQWLERARRLQGICARHGVPLAAAALQFPLAHPAVASVLLGVRSVAELDQNLELARLPIPSDLWRGLKGEGLLPEDAPTPAGEEVRV
jgi:D-threo-aldose 1-dehydrogenase